MYVMNYYLPNQSKEFSYPFSFCTRSFDELKSAVATAKANNYTITCIIRGNKDISLKALGYEENIPDKSGWSL